jgi:hypothetical protein
MTSDISILSQSPTSQRSAIDVIQVHNTTIVHLDFVEKILLEELIRQGRVEIVADMPDQTVGVEGRS